jgi:septal ring factor EnvC (AmiA/AmiB activator)
MSTHAIFDTSKINVPYISSLLIAAGLGAGVIFAIDAGFYRSFDAEIAHLESQVQAEKTANIKLLDRTKDLQEQLKVVQKNENSLKNQVIGKEQEIVKAHQQVEELSSQKSQLYTNAKTLALCVSDSQKLAVRTNDLVISAKDKGLWNTIVDSSFFLASMAPFHDSWNHGNCNAASDVAAELLN